MYEETAQEGTTNRTFKKIELEQGFTFDEKKVELQTETGTAEVTWYVKLQKYALVNLSKNVYNVRHLINGQTQNNSKDAQIVEDGAEPYILEALNSMNFLYTPNWAIENGINSVTFWKANETIPGDKKVGDFKNIENTNVWFNNTLANVSTESITMEPTSTDESLQYFRAFPSTTYKGNEDAVDNTTGGTGHYNLNDNTPAIGNLLAYCLENSSDVAHQTHGLSTGITFMAQVYSNPACTEPIKNMYRYKGYMFDSIEKIQSAFKKSNPELESLNENSTGKDLEAVGIAEYSSNTCYYYTTEIKHFDNGLYPDSEDLAENQTSLGNMEFAIMRNNIYSLSVSDIKLIGDPYVDPTPSTPDEIAKPKLTVEAKIMPWIVRYHDIEFK